MIDQQIIYNRHYLLDHPVIFTKLFGQYGNKEGIYSRHYMLAFPVFMADFQHIIIYH